MIPIDLDSVSLEDLKSLKDNSVSESKALEYKQELSLNNDNDKREFLSDISSFANTSGGEIIYGIKESSGIPVSLNGVEVENIDALKQKIENILRDNIEPRINGLIIKEILKEAKQYFIIIRIPQSWISPHRINYKGVTKFYARNANGKYELDVNELRIAFNLTGTFSSKVKAFREDRIFHIVSKDTPIYLEGENIVILHLVPLTSLNQTKLYDIKVLSKKQNYAKPVGSVGSWGISYNFDGIISFDRSQIRTRSYIQFFKNGIIEAVSTNFVYQINDSTKILPITNFENEFYDCLRLYFNYYKEINIDFPIFIFVSILNYKGFGLGVDNYISQVINPHSIDRDSLLIPEALVESSSQINFHQILRPIFDSLWNSCGFERCLHYDQDGRYNPK